MSLSQFRVLLSWILASSLAAAGCASSATQLIVTVDTDLLIPSELDRVEVMVSGPAGSMANESQALASTAILPLTLAVIPSGESLGPIDVVAIGYRGATEIVRRGARVTLVRGETRVLPLFLLASCRGVMCPAEQTCGESGCSSRLIADPPPWTGVPPRILRDAGPVDAPGVDAPGRDAPGADAPGSDAPGSDAFGSDAAESDAGPRCTTAASCDDGIDCTTDACDAAIGCTHQPNDMVCDDGLPCTTDSCGGMGCAHTANTSACDDGVYCNGFDTCAGGNCAGHAGNPCVGATMCDEATRRCTGCVSDSECPGVTTGAWSACDYADGCDEAAVRTRTVRTYGCMAGSCVGTDRMESEPCSRTTGGTSCGSGSCGAYGSCGGFTGACGESGTESRTCTDLVCGGGTCGAAMRMESRACMRSTTGASCGATTCGGYGSCTGFATTCAETGGMQTRTCTDYSCGGGACNATARMETSSCGRTTTGALCGTPVCGAWGTCNGATVCATMGSQSRTCVDMMCSGGTCVPGDGSVGTRSESQGCPRTTDGMSCDPDRCSPGSGVCSAGACSGSSDCIMPCYCPAGGAPVCRHPTGGTCLL